MVMHKITFVVASALVSVGVAYGTSWVFPDSAGSSNVPAYRADRGQRVRPVSDQNGKKAAKPSGDAKNSSVTNVGNMSAAGSGADQWDFKRPRDPKALVKHNEGSSRSTSSEEIQGSREDFSEGVRLDKLLKCMNKLIGDYHTAVFAKIDALEGVLRDRIDKVSALMNTICSLMDTTNSLRQDLEKACNENRELKQAGSALCELYRSRGICVKDCEGYFEKFGVAIKPEGFDYARFVESMIGRIARIIKEIKLGRGKMPSEVPVLLVEMRGYQDGVNRISNSSMAGVSFMLDIDTALCAEGASCEVAAASYGFRTPRRPGGGSSSVG